MGWQRQPPDGTEFNVLFHAEGSPMPRWVYVGYMGGLGDSRRGAWLAADSLPIELDGLKGRFWHPPMPAH